MAEAEFSSRFRFELLLFFYQLHFTHSLYQLKHIIKTSYFSWCSSDPERITDLKYDAGGWVLKQNIHIRNHHRTQNLTGQKS